MLVQMGRGSQPPRTLVRIPPFSRGAFHVSFRLPEIFKNNKKMIQHKIRAKKEKFLPEVVCLYF
jgi:hypothetical protein